MNEEAMWQVHRPGVDPELDKIIARRFGRDHARPCTQPTVLTCSKWECQKANRCQAGGVSR